MRASRFRHRGFTLIELLAVIAILGLLMGILLPAIGAARAHGRESVCLSNLRQCLAGIRAYADENRGLSPALGEPYDRLPNWALVVQRFAGEDGRSGAALYKTRSVLVCPSARIVYGMAMTRTYAMNVTGYSGAADDRGSYDDPNQPAHRDLDAVVGPPTPLLVDSARSAPPSGGAPPSSRTASVIDFRVRSHVDGRLHWRHRGDRAFSTGWRDGSASIERRVRDEWSRPFP